MEKTKHELRCGCGAKVATLALAADLHERFVTKRLATGSRCARCSHDARVAVADKAGKAAPVDRLVESKMRGE